MEYDLIIRGGTIYEGAGKPGYRGDVAVRGDRIAAVGKVDGSASRIIDADGKAVTPGFIDVHTHYDGQLFWDPLLTSSCWHGVTTIVMGNCGVAFAPCKPEQRELFNYMFSRVEGVPEDLLEYAVPWNWETYGEFMDAVQDRRPGLNVACLMGQSAVRAYVMNGDAVTRRQATPEEIARMKDTVREGMKAGAYGLTMSRMPNHIGAHGEPMPGAVATDAELIEVFSTVGEFGRGFLEFAGRSFTAHKDLAKEQEEDWALLSEIARRTGLPVSWVVLHHYGSPDNWRKLLDRTEEYNEQGLKFYAQTSPFISAPFDFTLENISSIFDDQPNWREVVKLPVEERRKAYRDPEVRKKLRFDVVEDTAPHYFHRRWDLVAVQKAVLEKNKQYEGKSIKQISEETGRDVFDIFMDLSLEEDMKTVFVTLTVNGDPAAVLAMIKHPKSLCSLADGGAHLSAICQTGYPSYILSHWVREKKALTIEEAVDILVTIPAESLGLTNRNGIKTGNYADLVVFDPDTIRGLEPQPLTDLPGDNARIIQRSEGIVCTIVNGSVLMEGCEHTGAYPGRVLRSNAQ